MTKQVWDTFLAKQAAHETAQNEYIEMRSRAAAAKAKSDEFIATNRKKIADLTAAIEENQQRQGAIKAKNLDEWREQGGSTYSSAISELFTERSRLHRENREAMARNSSLCMLVVKKRHAATQAQLDFEAAYSDLRKAVVAAAGIPAVNAYDATFSLINNPSAIRIEWGKDKAKPSSSLYGCCIVHYTGKVSHLRTPRL